MRDKNKLSGKMLIHSRIDALYQHLKLMHHNDPNLHKKMAKHKERIKKMAYETIAFKMQPNLDENIPAQGEKIYSPKFKGAIEKKASKTIAFKPRLRVADNSVYMRFKLEQKEPYNLRVYVLGDVDNNPVIRCLDIICTTSNLYYKTTHNENLGITEYLFMDVFSNPYDQNYKFNTVVRTLIYMQQANLIPNSIPCDTVKIFFRKAKKEAKKEEKIQAEIIQVGNAFTEALSITFSQGQVSTLFKKSAVSKDGKIASAHKITAACLVEKGIPADMNNIIWEYLPHFYKKIKVLKPNDQEAENIISYSPR